LDADQEEKEHDMDDDEYDDLGTDTLPKEEHSDAHIVVGAEAPREMLERSFHHKDRAERLDTAVVQEDSDEEEGSRVLEKEVASWTNVRKDRTVQETPVTDADSLRHSSSEEKDHQVLSQY
jgi:hypothetical protein